jgi:diguanylate cyclase (GGDEF)-like protein/PAS domain S-box-containing protein
MQDTVKTLSDDANSSAGLLASGGAGSRGRRGWSAAFATFVGSGASRVRLPMYLAFAAIVAAVLVGGALNLRLEDVRALDAAVLEQSAEQRSLAQQAGRLAALLVAEPEARPAHVQQLADLLTRSQGQALRLDELLLSEHAHPSLGVIGPAASLQAWEAARERLWYRGAGLLRAAESGGEIELASAAAAVQAEIEPTLQASLVLAAALRDSAAARREAMHHDVRLGVGGLLALLLVLALAVVEPAARSVRQHHLRLREQTARLRRMALVARHTSALVMITDSNDGLQWANDAFVRATGWPLAEALGRRPGELLLHPQADDEALLRMQRAVRDGKELRIEGLHRSRSGEDIWLDVDLCPLHGSEGELTGFVRVCTDVSSRAQQQAKLQTLWAALPAGVVVQDATGAIIEANRAAEQLLGLSLAQMQGRSSMHPDWRAVRADGSFYPGEEHPAMRTLATGQPLRNEAMGIYLSDGRLRWLMVNTEPQLDSQGQISAVVACFSDVTESRVLQDRLSSSARTDALTLLPNRAVVMERLQRALDHLKRNPGYGFAVLFMDFDRFKQVNDTLGHGAGDELLRQIAQRLTLAVRPGDAVARIDGEDSVAARLGGDEFVVVLDGMKDSAVVQVVAQRLLKELSEPYLVNGCMPVQSSASIGIVMCPGPQGGSDISAQDVLRNADTAMYEAKRAGRGRWVMFDDSMHERLVRALEVETDLRRALKEDELFVVYQPVVDLNEGSMVGVEALVRWRHPERGLVNPIEFIGVAEECGLIDAVGAVVLNKSCTQFMQWSRTLGAAAPRQLAVNLSRAQLEREGVAHEVLAVLEACGMPPEQLQLEVTESLAAQGVGVQANLRALKSLGVRLALDDFGTGYSSLACLHQLPVDTVKVDRSFVQHAETIEYHRVLIEATIRVARTLGMTTVAEGIETQGQAELMQTLDCDRGQGYLFSKPLEAPELARWALAQAELRAQRSLAAPV